MVHEINKCEISDFMICCHEIAPYLGNPRGMDGIILELEHISVYKPAAKNGGSKLCLSGFC
jgi:hypothetical protein